MIISFLFGLVAGSFLNVCIHRLPRAESIISPPSHCPRCQSRITWRDNIPVLSFILLRGRCRYCGEKISIRYPLVELITAVSSSFLFIHSETVFEYVVYFVFTAALITVSFIDLQHRIIPNRISLPGIVVGFLASFLLPGIGRLDSLLGIGIGGGSIALTILVYFLLTKQEGMGIGDAKLLAMIGAFLGWKGALFALVAGSFLGSAVGFVLIAARGWGRRAQIPFGPFLSIGGMAYLFGGKEVVTWYFSRLAGG